ncbi:MAG: oligoendopeptidase F [Deltaproteobacteria bacterium]|nr:oligoendopeptidase F [Deltaproteobacteria bacterium]
MIALLSLIAIAAEPAAAAAPVTAAPPPGAVWRLDHIFPTVEAFEKARGEASSHIPKLADCRGKLTSDAATLFACLQDQDAVRIEISRLSSYASNHASSDTRDDAWQAREGAVQQLWTDYSEAVSWADPEIIAAGAPKIESLLAAEPKLSPWAYPLRAVLRRGEHVLSADQERLLALSTAIAFAPSNTYQTFANAELPWPEITLPDGTKATLRQSEYSRLRVHPDPAVRKQVFDAFFGTLATYESTIGDLLATQVSTHWFYAQARKYPSSVEAALASDFLPRAIYDTLVTETRATLPTLHRYFALRGRMLGIEELTYADLYVPLVKSDRKYSLEESKRLTHAAMKPLGKEYQAALTQGYDAGWMDVYPAKGKRSGAYMDDSAWGVHPYVLLNHNDDWDSASTLAHEWGHALHSQLTNDTQPFATSGYSTFLAEIASTFNEALLIEDALKNAKTDDERLFYLGSALESLRTTYYRQAMFGEYELQIHAQVEKGEPLTGAALTALYADLLRDYHGSEKGIVRVDDAWTHEWAFIPHFYYDFYVWQYATSIAAASLLSERVLDKEKGAVDAYLRLLRSGSSDDPHQLLLKAGVDMTKPDAYRAVAARMDELMDEIEAILAKRAR